MHAPDCPPDVAALDSAKAGSALRRWWLSHWPSDAVSFSVASFPPSNVAPMSAALRLPGACAERPWLAVWGGFSGLLIQVNTSDTPLPVLPGSVFPYPFGVDLFPMADSTGAGASGVATFGLFTTREAALAFVGAMQPMSSSNPGSPSTGWADSKTATVTAPAAVNFPQILNDRTGLSDRLRQPDSYDLQSVTAAAVALTATGVKLTTTLTQNGILVASRGDITTQTNSAVNAILQTRITRGGTTFIVGDGVIGSGGLVGQVYALDGKAVEASAGGTAIAGIESAGVLLLSGDVLDINVSVACTVAGAMNLVLDFKTERAAF